MAVIITWTMLSSTTNQQPKKEKKYSQTNIIVNVLYIHALVFLFSCDELEDKAFKRKSLSLVPVDADNGLMTDHIGLVLLASPQANLTVGLLFCRDFGATRSLV